MSDLPLENHSRSNQYNDDDSVGDINSIGVKNLCDNTIEIVCIL